MSAEPQMGEQNLEDAAPTEAVLEQSQSEEQNRSDVPSSVPLSALQSEREQRQQLQEELKMIKDHLSLMQNSQQQVSNVPQKDDFDGIDDGDVMTFGEYKKITEKKERQYQQVLEEMRMQHKYPDYQEVIQKYLPEVLKSKPELGNSLRKNPDYELAYYLAKKSESYESDHKKKKKSQEAERILQNTSQAGSLSSMGSTTPISQAKRYKDMNDDDFRKLVNTNLGVI